MAPKKKKTSEDGVVLEHSSSPPSALLADFDIDSSTLKKLHKEWLDDTLVAAVKAKSHRKGVWEVRLEGRASQSGSDAHNLGLSDARLQAVETYVLSRVDAAHMSFSRHALGEAKPKDPAEYENELDRSVSVEARFTATSPPKLPPRIPRPKILKPMPWTPPKNRKVRNFTLKVLKAKIDIDQVGPRFPIIGIVGPAHPVVKLFIEIREKGSTDSARYEFHARGGMASITQVPGKKTSPGMPFRNWSQTFEDGATHDFTTMAPMDADDFATGAGFSFSGFETTFVFGPWSASKLRSEVKIRDLDLGKPTGPISVNAKGSCLVSDTLKLVTSTPSWAR